MSPSQAAVVLLGPTGSGKTPLGDKLEQNGLRSKCVHFDFGENLRQVAARDVADEVVSRRDIEFLRGVLQTGALLDDQHFPIAQRVLTAFLRQHQVDSETLVVLNGLPRHEGQARALDAAFDVSQVILLQCSPAVVRQRIACNAGGDRADRIDDSASDVERRLEIFAHQTAPLVEFYRQQGVVITTVPVTSTMSVEEMYALVAS